MVERSARDFLLFASAQERFRVQVHYGSARFTGPDSICSIAASCSLAKRRSRDSRFAQPAFVFAGDRFIIRDSSGRQTIAGGVVLDPHAEGTRFRAPAERSFLQARAAAPNDLVTLLGTQLQRDQFVRRAALLLQSSFSEEEITNAVDRLARREEERSPAGRSSADAAWWRRYGNARSTRSTRNTLRILSARASIWPNCAPTSRSTMRNWRTR